MNISPDDFEKLGIDVSLLDDKKEQTTYKIKYVRRYVMQWALVEVNRKEIQQINFIDCMCNAGVYKDGDACTALEVIGVFDELSKRFPYKKFVVYLNDINAKRIEIFGKIYQEYVVPQKNKNLMVFAKNKDVNDYLDMIEASSQNKRGLFAYGKCNLIYADPYNFGTVQIAKLHDNLEHNYCELLFNFFTSDFNRNKKQDHGRIQRCLGDLKPQDKKQVVDDVVKTLKVGKIKYVYLYSFRTSTNAEMYQILYATPSLKGLKVLKDCIWDVFNGEEYHRNHYDNGQLSMFTTEDIKMLNLQEYELDAQKIVYEAFKGQTVPFVKIEKKILLETILKASQIQKHVLKPLISEGKVQKCGYDDVRKSNFSEDYYTFI